jgi:hypothetical protein
MSSSAVRALYISGFVFAAVLVALFIFLRVSQRALVSHNAGASLEVSLIERGVMTRYRISDDHAAPVAHPAGYDAVRPNVVAAAPALLSGAVPVLAASEAPGSALGFMQNGAFTELLPPALRYALFDDGKDTVYYLEASSTGMAHLYRLIAEEVPAKPVDLGIAATAAAASDGSIVVVTTDGIVRIMPEGSSTPAILVPLPKSGLMQYPAVAPDASAAAYWSQPEENIKLYSLHDDISVLIASIRLPAPFPDAIGFASSGELVVKAGNTLLFYSAEDGAKEKGIIITS